MIPPKLWDLRINNLKNITIFHKATGEIIAEVFCSGRSSAPNGPANARLITASPDLLQALKELASFWAHGLSVPDSQEDSAKARKIAMERAEELGRMAGDAIAKAEGR